MKQVFCQVNDFDNRSTHKKTNNITESDSSDFQNTNGSQVKETGESLFETSSYTEVQRYCTKNIVSGEDTLNDLNKEDKENINIQTNKVSIKLLSESELRALPRSVRGRISLLIVNEAIAEIEQVFQKKYDILDRSNTRYSMYGSKHEYRQALIAHRELEVREHEGYLWVSEQDIRDACDFFRMGESSARVVLTILRNTKRLKQIPSGRHQTYRLM